MLRPSLLPGLLDALRAQPPARAARTSGCSRPAAASRGDGRRARGRGVRLDRRRRRPHWTAPARARSTSSTSRAWSKRVCAAVRAGGRSSRAVRAAVSRAGPRRGSVRSTRRAPVTLGDRRPAAAGDRGGARLPGRRGDLRRRARPRGRARERRAATTSAPSRCRAFRRSCATSRCSSTTALPAATVRGTIRSAAPPTLVSIVEFDRYQGKGVPDGQVSLSLRLTFRAAGSHADRRRSADGDRQTIVAALERSHGAEQR